MTYRTPILSVSLGLLLATAACGGESAPPQTPSNPPPPATQPAPAAPTEVQPAPGAAVSVSTQPGALDRMSADIDAQLAIARQRVATASGAARQDAERDLAAIEARARVVREQIKALPGQTNDAAEEARRKTVQAAEDLKRDLKNFVDRIR